MEISPLTWNIILDKNLMNESTSQKTIVNEHMEEYKKHSENVQIKTMMGYNIRMAKSLKTV